MQNLQTIVEAQIRASLGMTEEEFSEACHPAPGHLRDPFQYQNMYELIVELRKLRKEQEQDPHALLVIDGDYDTDGICGAVILAAALDVFGFRYQIYIPSMAEGYGLSQLAVRNMKHRFEQNGDRIHTILTADQGIRAYGAIRYARNQGIQVLVTDHHPGTGKKTEASAMVDPNQPGDRYPFKGNSGATVAWKTMLAYADRFDKEALPLIQDLILFAGISNVADVMPMRDENRYMVQAAMDRIRKIRTATSYDQVAHTPYPAYNTVFHGLYDVLRLLQEEKDQNRIQAGKKPVPLPDNEELIGWYLSPMLNAPRRVHDTCAESLAAFLLEDPVQRREMIRRLLWCNGEKSRLRDRVLENLSKEEKALPALCVNTRKGIAGLIAGQLSEQSGGMPSVIFASDQPDNPVIHLTGPDLPGEQVISGSARSSALCPLDLLFTRILEKDPNLFTWGGHAGGAGCSLQARNLPRFTARMQEMIPLVVEELLSQPSVILLPPNQVQLYLSAPNTLIALYPRIKDGQQHTQMESVQTETFTRDVTETIAFLDSLRPFGQDFPANTDLILTFSRAACKETFDPDFWKTFKFKLFGVEALTFDQEWAKQVKEQPEQTLFYASVKLQMNNFRGKVTPQMILTPRERPDTEQAS